MTIDIDGFLNSGTGNFDVLACWARGNEKKSKLSRNDCPLYISEVVQPQILAGANETFAEKWKRDAGQLLL